MTTTDKSPSLRMARAHDGTSPARAVGIWHVVRRSAPAARTRRAAAAAAQHVPIGQLPAIDIDALLAHTKMLSSDEFEGRAPGTKGEELTVTYLADQFQKVGLKPGNTDGTYFQKVPLVGITPTPAPLVFRKGGHAADAEVERRRRRVDEARGAERQPRQTPSSCSSATASSRPSSTGTTTRASTSRARRS